MCVLDWENGYVTSGTLGIGGVAGAWEAFPSLDNQTSMAKLIDEFIKE